MQEQLQSLTTFLMMLVGLILLIPVGVVMIKTVAGRAQQKARQIWADAAAKLTIDHRSGNRRSTAWSMKSGREATIEGDIDGRHIEAWEQRDLSRRKYKDFRFSTIVDVELESPHWNRGLRLWPRDRLDKIESAVIGDIADLEEGRVIDVGRSDFDGDFAISQQAPPAFIDALNHRPLQEALMELRRHSDGFEIGNGVVRIYFDRRLDDVSAIIELLRQSCRIAGRLDQGLDVRSG